MIKSTSATSRTSRNLSTKASIAWTILVVLFTYNYLLMMHVSNLAKPKDLLEIDTLIP